MEPYQLLIIAVLAAFIVPMLAWHFRRSRELVERWAAANSYTIVEMERRYLRAGPFFWWRGKGHEVFHVVVRDSRGGQHGVYVRTGGWMLGQLSEQVAVKWDGSNELR